MYALHITCLDQQEQNHALLLLVHTSAVSLLSFPGTAIDVIEVFKMWLDMDHLRLIPMASNTN